MNGSPTCTDGPLVGVVLAELLAREHGGAADPVAAGRRAVEDDERGPRPVAFARVSRSAGKQPDAHRVDEAVVAVRLVEDRLAADGRHADAVPVVRRCRRRRGEKWPVRLAEAEAVEQRDRPRAHRDDVAEDPADAGRGALERLDRGRVVVALDLERDGEPVAEVEHAGVLAGPLQHARPVEGSRFSSSAECL